MPEMKWDTAAALFSPFFRVQVSIMVDKKLRQFSKVPLVNGPVCFAEKTRRNTVPADLS